MNDFIFKKIHIPAGIPAQSRISLKSNKFRRNVMKRIITILFMCLCGFFNIVTYGQDKKINEWVNTPESKLWGLMTVWAQTKFAFPHMERLKEIDWDAAVQKAIPRVLSAGDAESYYNILMELTALLRDSHTEIIPPWGRMTPGFDYPAVEIKIIDDKFYVVRTGNGDELKRQNIRPGTEILEIGDGIPVRDYFRDNVLKYRTRGSKRADDALLIFYMLYGPAGTDVKVKIKNPDGATGIAALTRNAMTGKGGPFMYEFLPRLFAATITSRMIDENILYVEIPNLDGNNEKIRDDFIDLIDKTDFSNVKGLIIDLRYNMGGSHRIMQPMLSCLIDNPVRTPLNHYLQYTPARAASGGGSAFTVKSENMEISPRQGKRFSGCVAVLMSPVTHSSAEDMIIELMQNGKCITVGEPTAGGAGGSYPFELPGGGEFSLSTFKATMPDGTEYMADGIQPDVPVKTSIKDILSGRDRVLEKGIEVIKSKI